MTNESASEWLVELFERNRAFTESDPALEYETHDPDVVTVSCCDARVPQDELFGTGPGENFTVAKIGNAVTERDATGEAILSGSVLYPVEKTSPRCVIVIGHTDCGAVTAAWNQVARDAAKERPELQNELDLLVPIIETGLERFDPDPLDSDEQITRLVEYNVDRQVELLSEEADVPVVGVVCDLHGYYTSRHGACHLVNYDGARSLEALPDELEALFRRKLEY